MMSEKYFVRWRFRLGGRCCTLGPMSKQLADRILRLNERVFTEADHWMEQAPSPNTKHEDVEPGCSNS